MNRLLVFIEMKQKFSKWLTQKCFRLFLSLWRTASQPYKLSHTNALCINQFYKPKDQSMKFSWKNIENWRSWKMFFWVGHFDFFCFISMKTSSLFICGIIYFSNMDIFFRILEKTSSELICTRLYTHYWYAITEVVQCSY